MIQRVIVVMSFTFVCTSLVAAQWSKLPKVMRTTVKVHDIAAKFTSAEQKIKEACGCSVSLDIDANSFKGGTRDMTDENAALSEVKIFAASLSSASQKFCSDDVSKKEFCQAVTRGIVSFISKSDEKKGATLTKYDKGSKTILSYVNPGSGTGVAQAFERFEEFISQGK